MTRATAYARTKIGMGKALMTLAQEWKEEEREKEKEEREKSVVERNQIYIL